MSKRIVIILVINGNIYSFPKNKGYIFARSLFHIADWFEVNIVEKFI